MTYKQAENLGYVSKLSKYNFRTRRIYGKTKDFRSTVVEIYYLPDGAILAIARSIFRRDSLFDRQTTGRFYFRTNESCYWDGESNYKL